MGGRLNEEGRLQEGLEGIYVQLLKCLHHVIIFLPVTGDDKYV